MRYLPFGSTMANGLLYDIMERDLANGFIGNLDKLVPSLIADDDIYGENRRGAGALDLDLGVADVDTVTGSQYQWWNAETQGNWLDGFIRTAILVGDKAMIAKATDMLVKRMGREDYIGIYKSGCRYNSKTENGELWAKTTLLRAALALYDYTNDSMLLDRVVKAVEDTMQGYPIHASHPFAATDEADGIKCCGVGHGLTFVDLLYSLYRYTGNKRYLDYAGFLYEDYSVSKHVEDDAQAEHLLDSTHPFSGHGVHTYEHLRAVILADKTGELTKAYLEKLQRYLVPSGAPIGDEWICPDGADTSLTGYEYCSLQELLHSYATAMEYKNDLSFADNIEWLFYNAALGARHQSRSAIAYLKSDNSYAMQSVFQSEQSHCPINVQTRYKYSPTHQDAAVCCVPNAGRIIPYYIGAMWLKTDNGLIKALYGDSQVRYGDITVTEVSNYPFDNVVHLTVDAASPIHMELSLRVPSWCTSVIVDDCDYLREGNLIKFSREWHGKTEITLTFERSIKAHCDAQGDRYFSYGGILLSLPLDGIETVVKTHPVDGFVDNEYTTTGYYDYKVNADTQPIVSDSKILCDFIRADNGEVVRKELIPIGKTILRKATFAIV